MNESSSNSGRTRRWETAKDARTRRREPSPIGPPRRLVVLTVVMGVLLLAFVATAPYRARLVNELGAMQRQRRAMARLQAAAGREAADRQRREAQVAADLKAHPDDPSALLRAGLAYLNLGEAARAAAVLEPASRARPRDAALHAALGQTYEAERRLDLALDEYQTARRLAPGDPAHDLRTAALLSRLAWRQEALRLLRDTVSRSPRHAGARIALAMLLFQSGDLRGAEEQLRRAHALEPGNAAVPGLLADVYATGGRLPEARQAVETALRLRSNDPDFLALRAEIEQASGDLDGAERDARAALLAQPGQDRALATLTRTLRARGRPAEALAALEPLLASATADEGTLQMGTELARQLGQHSRAEGLARRHARRQAWRRDVARLGYRADLSPKDPALHLRLGQAYLTAGDNARAVVELRRALELRPGWEAAQRDLARARAANEG